MSNEQQTHDQRSRRLMKRIYIACVALCAVAVPSQAQESGLAFLRIGTDAAAMALGDAHVAHSRDAWATYWNPAGLAASAVNAAALSHHIWIADVRTYALAARFRAGVRGGVGLFVTATGSGDLEVRERPGEAEGFFNAQFVSAGVSYGHRVGPLRAGVTAKYLAERIYVEDANGYAFDAGLQADLFGGSIQLGAALQNLGRMSELSAVATPLPRTFRLGGAVFPFRILMADDEAPLLNTFMTAEVSHVFLPQRSEQADDGERTRLHVGVAAEVLELVMLRAGLITNDAVRSFTFGGGLGFGAFDVDYAFIPFQGGFSSPGHVLTLAYKW